MISFQAAIAVFCEYTKVELLNDIAELDYRDDKAMAASKDSRMAGVIVSLIGKTRS